MNHLERPLTIQGGTTTNERYATGLATVEPGQRYRLVLAMTGRGASGRQTDTIALQTDDAAMPVVSVPARTLLRERVYTFPESVDFGQVGAASPQGERPVETALMIYQKNGEDFQIQVASDLPFLEIRPEKSTTYGDRWQILCSLDPTRMQPGRLEGSITVVTNDPEFPKLTIPVRAVLN